MAKGGEKMKDLVKKILTSKKVRAGKMLSLAVVTSGASGGFGPWG
jgi:hypothetical protein